MDQKELARCIYSLCKLSGAFTLRSGKRSSFYFDKYRFESNPNLLDNIAFHMAKMIPKNIDLLGGLELGGVPLATALSLKTKIPCVFIRKQAKTYGTCSLVEGCEIANKKIALIEDIITTGGQVCESAGQVREQGAIVQYVLCVIDRSANSKLLQKNQLQLKSLFTFKDFDPL